MPVKRVLELPNLKRFKNLSWLSASRATKVARELVVRTFQSGEIIFDERTAPKSIYILLSGTARITCLNRKGQRVLVVMVPPGMVSGLPQPVSGTNCGFRCEASTSCQVGAISFNEFTKISLDIDSVTFKQMAFNYLGQWNLVQLRCSNFMRYSLQERLALALLELSEDFGIPGNDGVRLHPNVNHTDLAELVGASRPRVTEYLLQFEKVRLVARKKRQLIVQPDRIENFMSPRQTLRHRSP
jgi:CRP/FNR family transcriptional regulator